jgi:hypothetical protein
MKKKIGIVTWHYYVNFGSALQAYALQTIIEEYGYTVFFIDYRNPIFGVQSPKIDKLRNIFSHLSSDFEGNFRKRFYQPFLQFRESYFHETKRTYRKEDLPNLVKNFDICIAGSDQIWAPNVFNPIYMLDFVPSQIRKISYAASIGLNEIPDNLISQYRKLLIRFSKISVREDVGKKLLLERCGINSELVLDPTLLIEVNKWRMLEKKCHGVNGKYTLCYFLNDENHYCKKVMEFIKLHEYKIYGISAKGEDSQWMNFLNKVGPCEFLWLIDNAEMIFTDSYHGAIFAMLFHKPFIVFERFQKNDIICQNSRIYQLTDSFNMKNIIYNIDDYNPYISNDIDYGTFDNILKKLRRKSKKYLEDALQ